MLSIRMNFAEDDNLLLECFADKADFRFQVIAIRMDFVKGDNLSPECFIDGANFMFHALANSCWEIYKGTSKL